MDLQGSGQVCEEVDFGKPLADFFRSLVDIIHDDRHRQTERKNQESTVRRVLQCIIIMYLFKCFQLLDPWLDFGVDEKKFVNLAPDWRNFALWENRAITWSPSFADACDVESPGTQSNSVEHN